MKPTDIDDIIELIGLYMEKESRDIKSIIKDYDYSPNGLYIETKDGKEYVVTVK